MLSDEFGPEYVIRVSDPVLGMRGFLVIDNTALGLGKGGIRMTPTVSEEEVFRLARTMTWKNALAGIPFGGAKAGIIWKGGSLVLKKKFVQSFARAIKLFIPRKYIAGPDVNTTEREMKWIVEALGSRRAATGKPASLAGLPHELGSTGFGVAQATRIALALSKIDIRRATVAIEGFGNVGSFTAKFLQEWGAKIIAVADSRGAIFLETGLDQQLLHKLKTAGKFVADYPQGRALSRSEFWGVKTDVLIPAAVTDAINQENKNAVRTKIIVEGANIPLAEAIEEEFHRRGVLVVPDFVANAGGVISSYAEYRGYSAEKMFKLVEEKIVSSTTRVLEEALRRHQSPRRVALELAMAKVKQAMVKKKKAF